MENSPKQGTTRVRTAYDLERKLNLSSLNQIPTMQKAIEQNQIGITKVDNSLQEFVVETLKDIENLQEQIDGNITTWFYKGVPTTENEPAKDWIDEVEKINHLGDLYYDQDTGYAYRWTKQNDNYLWLELKDSDVTEALAVANSAKDTADSKRRTFIAEPRPPYDVGDIWFTSDGTLLRCGLGRQEGDTFNRSDWIDSLKYTDDTAANEAMAQLNSFKTTVETTYETRADFIKEKEALILEVGKVETVATNADTKATNALTTADGKNKVFTTQPTVPYKVGDVWIKETTEQGIKQNLIYVCQVSKDTGFFDEKDFSLQPSYASQASLKVESDKIDAAVNAINTIEYDVEETKEEEEYPVEIYDALEKDMVSIEFDGKTYQETRSGKNVLIYPYTDTTKTSNGITFTDIGDGTIRINGTATGNASFTLNSGSSALREKILNKKITISGCISGGSVSSYRIQLWNYNASNGFIYDIGNGGTGTFTNSSSGFNIVIYIPNGVTMNNVVFKPMIEISDKKTEYEQYGAMPSPEYPSEVQNVKGVTNLFDKSTLGEFTTSLKYIDLTLKPNTNYTFSSNLPLAHDTYADYNNIFFINNGESANSNINGISPTKPRTLKTDSTGKVRIGYRDYTNVLSNEKSYEYQLEPGTISHTKTYTNYSSNIFDGNIIQGVITETMEAGSIATRICNDDYISVTPNTNYLIKADSSKQIQVQVSYCGDDKNVRLGTSNWTNLPYTYLSPNNAKYFKLCFRYSDGTNILPTNISNVTLQQEIITYKYYPYGTWLEQTSRGKNLFDKNSNILFNSNVEKEIQDTGVKIKLTKSSTYSFGTFKIGNLNDYYGKTITLSCNAITSGTNDASMYIGYADNDGNNRVALVIKNSFSGKSQITANINVKNDNKCLIVALYGNSASTTSKAGDYVEYKDLLLEQGSGVTSYEPYQTNVVKLLTQDNEELLTESGEALASTERAFINMNYVVGDVPVGTFVVGDNIELCKKGNVKDTFKDGVITKRIGKYICTNNDNWEMSKSGDYYRFITRNLPNKLNFTDTSRHKDNIMCNLFTPSIENKNGIVMEYQEQLIFYAQQGITTLDQWKQWLSNNPVEVYYILETPYTIKTQYNKLPLLKGYNYIELVDEVMNK